MIETTPTRRLVPNHYGNTERHPWRIVPCNPRPLKQSVARWDIYDAADSLDDIPGLIQECAGDPDKLLAVARLVQMYAARLYRLSETGGNVGPFPTYENH
jgi:hypothetical protein